MGRRAKKLHGHMNVTSFDIDGPLLIEPKTFGDERGYFMEAFKQLAFNDAVGRPVTFVQDNQSLSAQAGTVRGLHYQSPPHGQGKLVRCLQGAIIDIAVDARTDSSTFGQHVRAELSAENNAQLWVPEGFLHGFATLKPNTIVFYKVTDVYAPDCDGSVRFDDPALGLDWGISIKDAILSEKDKAAPSFRNWQSPF